MISEGKVTARATGASIGLTLGNKEQVGIAFDLLDGPDAGQSITAYGSFSGAALPYTLEKMRTAGWRGDDLADLSSIGGPKTPDVQLVIEHEEYNGKLSAKVKFINSLGGVAMKEVLDAKAAQTFAARMRGAVLAHNQSTGAPTKPPATPARPAARPASRTASPARQEPPPPTDADAPPDFDFP